MINPINIDLYIDYEAETSVKVIPNINAKPDDGFAISKLDGPHPAEVTFKGPRSVVGGFREILTEKEDLTGIRNNVTLTLALQKPEGFGIKLEPDSVSLTVEVAPVKTRVFEDIPIVIYNAPLRHKLTVEPDKIRVEVNGPATGCRGDQGAGYNRVG